jgi:protein-disulfide isomerase
MFVRYTLLICVTALLLSSCSKGNENEKILEELKTIRAEMAQLREAVSDIHRIALKSNQNTGNNNKNVAEINIKLDVEAHAVLGDESAKVTIVEFSDFQCPFCARFHKQTFPSIKKDYIDTGKVKYILMDYPLGFHGEAVSAALAANCAARQNAYWEMKDGLFENQRQLNQQLYGTLAQKYKLDINKFETCLKDPQEKSKIDRSLSLGQQLAVNGTPHFFIGNVKNGQLVNARRVAGAQPYASFSKVLDSFL